MEANTLKNQHILLLEQENTDQAFWCEPVDLADGEADNSHRISFDDGPQCGCGCTCSCSCN